MHLYSNIVTPFAIYVCVVTACMAIAKKFVQNNDYLAYRIAGKFGRGKVWRIIHDSPNQISTYN